MSSCFCFLQTLYSTELDMHAAGPCSTQEGYSFDDDEAKAAVKLLDKNNDG